MSMMHTGEDSDQLLEENFSAVGDLLSQEEERTLSLHGIKEQLNHLMGETLTIIDAALTDHVQRKAVKDLVKQRFYAKEHWIYEFVTMDKEEGSGSLWVVDVKDRPNVKAA